MGDGKVSTQSLGEVQTRSVHLLSPNIYPLNRGKPFDILIHTTCLYLSEALSGFSLLSYPRLRSLSLGLLRSQPHRGCKSLLRVEDGDKPHPYIGFHSAIPKRRENILSASKRHTFNNPRLSERSECSLGDLRKVSIACRVRPLWPSAT